MENNRGVERALTVLELIGKSRRTGCRLGDVVAGTGLQKSTVHRLLRTLTDLGWVEQDAESGLFFLGMSVAALGIAASDRHGLLELADPHLSRLATMTEDTVYLSVRSGPEALCVDRVTGSFPIRTLTLEVGDRRPLGVGAGSLALLAWLPDDEVNDLLEQSSRQFGHYPRLDRATVTRLVKEARQQGYAFNPGMLVPGMSALGVPVMGVNHRAVASLSVAAIDARMMPDRRTQVVNWATKEAADLAVTLESVVGEVTEAGIRRLSPDSDSVARWVRGR